MKNNHLVIMAGGIGSRFWPMSSEERPKQFLDVLGCGRTLIQLTLDRFKGICPLENVWVVTSDKYASIVAEQLPELKKSNILEEPCRRNTAPCIAYVSWKIKSIDPRANIIVAPSDHVISDIKNFQSIVKNCLEFASETDSILTIGIKPNKPATQYGYIDADLSYSSSRNSTIFRVDGFKEKPDINTAQEYLKQTNMFWNSGIFIWSVNTIINAFRVYCPDLAKKFQGLMPYYNTPEEQEHVNEVFPTCENISIDYAIMEKAEEIFVCPGNFDWSDLGSWSALRSKVKQDIHGNACVGKNINLYDTNNCIIHATSERKVVVQGLDGYIVVEKDGVLMICKLSEEQRIQLFKD